MISYEDFSAIEIRIGHIREVSIVEGADKLLRCIVDFGELDEAGNPKYRQILSGIREYLEDPQTLVGKKFPYVTNLASRTIRGYESEGMILAGLHEGTLALLTPTADVPPGTKIK